MRFCGKPDVHYRQVCEVLRSKQSALIDGSIFAWRKLTHFVCVLAGAAQCHDVTKQAHEINLTSTPGVVFGEAVS